MIKFLYDGILQRVHIPTVLTEFREDALAATVDQDSSSVQQGGRQPDAIQYAVIRIPNSEFTMPPDRFLEAGGGRINDHPLDPAVPGQSLQRSVVFFVRQLVVPRLPAISVKIG